MKKSIQLLGVALLTTALIACGGDKKETTETTEVTPTEETTTTEAPAEETATVEVSNDLTLEGTDDMKFNISEFKVKAGQEVTLTLKHTGKQPKDIMGHNFVLLKPGTDVSKFGLAAANAKDTDYIPADESASVIAHSKVIGGGEQDVVKFTLEPGTYEYICSFPGHYSVMKGVIIAE